MYVDKIIKLIADLIRTQCLALAYPFNFNLVPTIKLILYFSC
jgi:hypothetical protein